MAFIMTLNLFLAASAQSTTDYETLPIRDEYKTNSTSTQFVDCAINTTFGLSVTEAGDTLDGETCALLSDEGDRICQNFPDVSPCCPNRCREKLVCDDDFLNRVEDETDTSPYTLTSQCMATTWYPAWYQFWLWFASWQREAYNTCKKIEDHAYTSIDYPELEFCCPQQNLAASTKLKAEYPCANGPITTSSTNAPPGKACTKDGDCPGQKCVDGHCTVPSTPIVTCKKDSDCSKEKHKKKCIKGICSAASTVYGLTAALVLMLFAF